MPKLSPAAEAVLDAAYRRMDENPHNEVEATIAAALEELVDQADPKRHVEDIGYQHQMYVDGWKDCLEVIRNIAAELKAHA